MVDDYERLQVRRDSQRGHLGIQSQRWMTHSEAVIGFPASESDGVFILKFSAKTLVSIGVLNFATFESW